LSFRSNRTDVELRRALDDLLRPLAGYLGIDEVDPDKKEVIYSVLTGEEWLNYRQKFTDKGGKVELSGEPEQVKAKTQYVSVAATAAVSECGCHNKDKQGDRTMNKDQRIAALIEKSHGRFNDGDKTWLNTVPEDRLTALEAQVFASTTEVKQPVKTETPAPEKAQVVSLATAEQFIGSLPPAEQAEIREALRVSTERKNELIELVKKNPRNKFTETALKAMSVGDLQNIVEMATPAAPAPARNFTGQAPSRTASASDEIAPPPSLVATIRAARQGK
jgi:hypothetical protein